MRENLSPIIRELRNETCPERVLAETARRISAQAPPPRPYRFAIGAAFAGLALLYCLAILQPSTPLITRQPSKEARSPAPADRAQTTLQAKAALAFIGRVLVDAGERSQKTIFDQAVPPLRNSIDTAKEKTINHIKL